MTFNWSKSMISRLSVFTVVHSSPLSNLKCYHFKRKSRSTSGHSLLCLFTSYISYQLNYTICILLIGLFHLTNANVYQVTPCVSTSIPISFSYMNIAFFVYSTITFSHFFFIYFGFGQ